MNSSRVLIKLGGAALQDESVLHTVTEAILEYRHYGYQVILVHGGGPAINAELTRRGIQWSFVNGQRVTTPDMMEVIEGVLCGNINRKLIRHLAAHGLPTVGFSGADSNTLLCRQASEELGQVGTIIEVAAKWIDGLLALPNAPIPVIAPIGIGENGEAFNINADWAACHLAAALKAEYLIFLTDQNGILDAKKKPISRIDPMTLRSLIETSVVTGGMLTKTNSILHALDHGVKGVRVMSGKDAVLGLWSNYIGTWCTPGELHA
jgi:acetylglutamate kinase